MQDEFITPIPGYLLTIPNKLRDIIKENINSKVKNDLFSVADYADFRTILTRIDGIIKGTEPFTQV